MANRQKGKTGNILVWVGVFCFFSLYGKSYSQPAAILSSRVDYTLVIDNSTSISTLEEKNLMRQAVHLFIDILKEGDQLSLLTFGDSAKVLINEVLPISANRSQIHKKINASSLSFLENRSNITAAFETIVREPNRFWREKDRTNKSITKIIILVSDGRLYTSKERSLIAYQKLVQIIETRLSDVKIHCLEITTNEATKKIPGLPITGTELLKELTKREPDYYESLDGLVDVGEKYLELVKENSGIINFAKLSANQFSIGQNTRETQIYILKRTKDLQPVESEDLELRLKSPGGVDKIVTFKGAKKVPEYGLTIDWRSKEGFDVISIKIDTSSIGNLPFESISPDGISYVMTGQVNGIDYGRAYVSSQPNFHLEPNIYSYYLQNQRMEVKVEIFKNDPLTHEKPILYADSLASLVAYIGKGMASGVPNMDNLQFPMIRTEKAFYIDISQAASTLETGKYHFYFVPTAKNGNTYPGNGPFYTEIKEDYLQPQFPNRSTKNNIKPLTFPLYVELDTTLPAFVNDLGFQENRLFDIGMEAQLWLGDSVINKVKLDLTEERDGQYFFGGELIYPEKDSSLFSKIEEGKYYITYHLTTKGTQFNQRKSSKKVLVAEVTTWWGYILLPYVKQILIWGLVFFVLTRLWRLRNKQFQIQAVLTGTPDKHFPRRLKSRFRRTLYLPLYSNKERVKIYTQGRKLRIRLNGTVVRVYRKGKSTTRKTQILSLKNGDEIVFFPKTDKEKRYLIQQIFIKGTEAK